MAKVIDKVIVSNIPPKNTNVLWDNGKNLNIFRNGKWESIGGGADIENRLSTLEKIIKEITETV